MVKIRKRRYLIIATAIIVSVGIICLGFSNLEDNNQNYLKNKKEESIAMLVENGTGDYVEVTTREFPTLGYSLNTEKTFCINSGVITQNEEDKSIEFKTGKADKCKLYYDIVPEIVSVDFDIDHKNIPGGTASTVDIHNINMRVPQQDVTYYFKTENCTYYGECETDFSEEFTELPYKKQNIYFGYESGMWIQMKIYYIDKNGRKSNEIVKTIVSSYEDEDIFLDSENLE